jgi:hypothetical protein
MERSALVAALLYNTEMGKGVLITKQDGTQEVFDEKKLHRSLARSGASERESQKVIKQVTDELKDGMTTSQIYKHAFSLLKDIEKPTAARYSMKRAVLALGPSGYPFENFVAEIFRARGFNVEVGKIVRGKCVEHELDIFAEGKGKRVAAELKFHNHLGIKSDLQVALYVHARFEDLNNSGNNISDKWLITNTKFTNNAIMYGKCVGLTMVSWNYPAKMNLQDMIEEAGVQPITALTTLSKGDMARLMDNQIVLCRHVRKNADIMRSAGISRQKIENIIAESQALCGIE